LVPSNPIEWRAPGIVTVAVIEAVVGLILTTAPALLSVTHRLVPSKAMPRGLVGGVRMGSGLESVTVAVTVSVTGSMREMVPA